MIVLKCRDLYTWSLFTFSSGLMQELKLPKLTQVPFKQYLGTVSTLFSHQSELLHIL